MAKNTSTAPKSRMRVTLTTQILGAVGGALAVLAIVGVTSILQLSKLDTASRDAAHDQEVVSKSVLDLSNALWVARLSAGTVASYPEADRAAHMADLEANYAKFETQLTTFGTDYQATFGHEPSGLAAVTTAWAAYKDLLLNKMMPTAVAGDLVAYTQIREGGAAQAGAGLVEAVGALTQDANAEPPHSGEREHGSIKRDPNPHHRLGGGGTRRGQPARMVDCGPHQEGRRGGQPVPGRDGRG